MVYRLLADALEYRESERWVKIGGYINVLARTHAADQKRCYGALLEWRNLDGVLFQEIILIKVLQGGDAEGVRDMLIDSGYQLEPGPQAWQQLLGYLLSEVQRAESAISVEQTGWHARTFVGPDWAASRGNVKAPLLSKGQNTGAAGTVEQWQEEVGKFCCGNPFLIFCCGVALSAPLLSCVGAENVIFHLYGAPDAGKSIARRVAISLLGNESLVQTWMSAADDLAATAALHHDIPLLLGKLSQARAEDVDTVVNAICHGHSMLLANGTGRLAIGEPWRTVALSTGEVTLAEHMAQRGKQPLAGQLRQLVEIPVAGEHGVFDALHDFSRADQLADEVLRACRLYHGTLFPAWVNRLVSYEDAELARKVSNLFSYRTALMTEGAEILLGYPVSPQVMWVIRQFALVQVALIIANSLNLLPWPDCHSTSAVERCFNLWLKNRGHGLDTENYQLFCTLKDVMQSWGPDIRPLGSRLRSRVGYSRTHLGERQWLVKTEVLKEALNLRPQYRPQMMKLVKHDWLQFNDLERLTLTLEQENEAVRYFAIWPERIRKGLAKLEIN